MNLDHFSGIFLQLWKLALCKELPHDERTLVLNKVGTNAFLLVLACLVHKAEQRVDSELHSCIKVALLRHFQEVELGIQLRFEIDLSKVLVEELEEHKYTVSVDQKLRKVHELNEVIRLEVLQHEQEEVTDDHCHNDSVSIHLELVVFHLCEH